MQHPHYEIRGRKPEFCGKVAVGELRIVLLPRGEVGFQVVLIADVMEYRGLFHQLEVYAIQGKKSTPSKTFRIPLVYT
jgi:hypothetical protein